MALNNVMNDLACKPVGSRVGSRGGVPVPQGTLRTERGGNQGSETRPGTLSHTLSKPRTVSPRP